MFNSVVKEICFEHQYKDDVNVCLDVVVTYLTTKLIPSAFSPFKLNLKKLLGQDCPQMGKTIFTLFWCKVLSWKISKWQLFLSFHRPPLF